MTSGTSLLRKTRSQSRKSGRREHGGEEGGGDPRYMALSGLAQPSYLMVLNFPYWLKRRTNMEDKKRRMNNNDEEEERNSVEEEERRSWRVHVLHVSNMVLQVLKRKCDAIMDTRF